MGPGCPYLYQLMTVELRSTLSLEVNTVLGTPFIHPPGTLYVSCMHCKDKEMQTTVRKRLGTQGKVQNIRKEIL